MDTLKDFGTGVLGYLQKIGKSLMLPVAVLPAAAILMGVGYWIDSVGDANAAVVISSYLLTAGGAIIGNIPILFAAGVAYGLSKKGDGTAAIAGIVGYLVFITLLSAGSAETLRGSLSENYELAFNNIENAFIGILSGIIGGHTYNRFHKVELPRALAFFSGKRLVPIMTSFIVMVVSLGFLFVWPVIFSGLTGFGEWIGGLGIFGAGIFGFFNRLLIPLGLHHALNAVFWFEGFGIADLTTFLDGTGVQGEAGRYMAGFFPIFMFGLPGAALAIIHTSKPENRAKVSSIMIGAAFASFFTGITEPIEFAFLFVAPLLFLAHAVLTGISMIIAAAIPALSGFGFSAGVVDMILQAQNDLAVNWWLLPIIGVAFFFIYYFLFRFLIVRFDLPTPGRRGGMGDDDDEDSAKGGAKHAEKAKKMLAGLGGKENIDDFDYCVTRLRVKVIDPQKVDREALKKAGASDVLRSSKNIQVIVGTDAQFIAGEVEELI